MNSRKYGAVGACSVALTLLTFGPNVTNLFAAPQETGLFDKSSVEVENAPTRCASLIQQMAGKFSDASTHLVGATLLSRGPLQVGRGSPGAPPLAVPEHCDVTGVSQERAGRYGQRYAIRFHIRLPTRWNGRFLFQGGGGSNGDIGNALGPYSRAAKPALLQGFAVVSQDSGHSNELNNDPNRGGILAFGFDERARANYGYASLPVVADAAKAIIREFYGAPPRHSYFVGCSKGGQEGLAFAERYPLEFEGIAAIAPGLSLPRAAVEQAWDVQTLASAASASAETVTLAQLAAGFSDSALTLVRDAVLAACDADDGAKDGIVGDFTRCSTERVRPELLARSCSALKTADCLSASQITALVRLMGGARDRHNTKLYSTWPWDTGIASPDWRAWKLGSVDGRVPNRAVTLGGASLPSLFTTPPTVVSSNPRDLLAFLLHFDFDRDAPKIYATSAEFAHSAWADDSARSADLRKFNSRKGKLIVPQGVSDPVFSINDTIAWWREVNERNGGHANSFVRVFPVPGMNHCDGGPSTDRFDVLAALMRWVEQGRAPDFIPAAAGPASPWPGRTRPLCPYPAVARYKGSGDVENASSFKCRP